MSDEIIVKKRELYPYAKIPIKFLEMGFNPDTLAVYAHLVKHAGGSENGAFAKRSTMCSKIWPHLSFNAARVRYAAAIRSLLEWNIIERKLNPGRTTTFFLNHESNWHLIAQRSEVVDEYDPPGSPSDPGVGSPSDPGVGSPSDPGPTTLVLTRSHSTRSPKLDPLFCEPPAALAPERSQSHSANYQNTQTPNQPVQATVVETSKQRGGLEPSREIAIAIPKQTKQIENNGGLTVLKQSKATGVSNDISNTTTEVWKAYSEAYGRKYKGPGGIPIQPPRNARTNQVCKKLVDHYGVQIALGLVNFIFYSKDAYIIRNTHSLLAPNDACWQSLYTQMMSGQRMTQTKATQEDKHGALDDVAARAIERWSQIERERNEKR